MSSFRTVKFAALMTLIALCLGVLKPGQHERCLLVKLDRLANLPGSRGWLSFSETGKRVLFPTVLVNSWVGIAWSYFTRDPGLHRRQFTGLRG